MRGAGILSSFRGERDSRDSIRSYCLALSWSSFIGGAGKRKCSEDPHSYGCDFATADGTILCSHRYLSNGARGQLDSAFERVPGASNRCGGARVSRWPAPPCEGNGSSQTHLVAWVCRLTIFFCPG